MNNNSGVLALLVILLGGFLVWSLNYKGIELKLPWDNSTNQEEPWDEWQQEQQPSEPDSFQMSPQTPPEFEPPVSPSPPPQNQQRRLFRR